MPGAVLASGSGHCSHRDGNQHGTERDQRALDIVLRAAFTARFRCDDWRVLCRWRRSERRMDGVLHRVLRLHRRVLGVECVHITRTALRFLADVSGGAAELLGVHGHHVRPSSAWERHAARRDVAAMTKVVLAVVGFLGLAIVVFVYLAMYYPGRREAAQRVEAVVSRARDGQAAQLAAQVEELQRSLNALKSQMPRHEEGAAHAVPTSDTKPAELSVEEQRAQDRERLRTYMAGVAQSFANERVDAAWANSASSRVATTFEGDEVLKGVA